MKDLVEKIVAQFAEFEKEARANVENGNKAAGTRARKASLELEKLMKQFRAKIPSRLRNNRALTPVGWFHPGIMPVRETAMGAPCQWHMGRSHWICM